MRFLTRHEVRERFEGRSVAVVGSGPGVLQSAPGFVDGHDIVVRVNNYKLLNAATGHRVDVFYSFFGSSIRKESPELKRDGVTLCMCKCPNAQPIESEWHRKHKKMGGIDFTKIYRRRNDWWFCPTYIPEVEDFMATFRMLGGRVPTTGFAAILDVISFNPSAVYLTGFDFFTSGKHNVNEPWRVKKENNDDPIGHVPKGELEWLAANLHRYPITTDPLLTKTLKTVAVRSAA